MGFSDVAKNKMMGSKTGVGLGMVLVGVVAAGSVAKSKRKGGKGGEPLASKRSSTSPKH